MKWGLIATDEHETLAVNTVENVIAYDGEAAYTPAAGLVLRQIADDVEINDVVDTDGNKVV